MVDYDFADTDRCKCVRPHVLQSDAYEDFDQIVAIMMLVKCLLCVSSSTPRITSDSATTYCQTVIRAGLDIDDITLEALAFAPIKSILVCCRSVVISQVNQGRYVVLDA